jgi:hypothetical protein
MDRKDSLKQTGAAYRDSRVIGVQAQYIVSMQHLLFPFPGLALYGTGCGNKCVQEQNFAPPHSCYNSFF